MISDGAMSVPLMLEETKAPEPKQSPNISHVTIEKVIEAPKAPESDLDDMKETLKSYDKLFESGAGAGAGASAVSRTSSQTARPDYDEMYEHYYAQYTKPKVKLGPRPRPSLEGKRPSTSGSVAHVPSRPKSSLPAGLRSATKKAADQRAAKPRDMASPPTLAIPQPPPIPQTPDLPSSPMSLNFTARTPASVRSMPVSGYSTLSRTMGSSQEKTRLMKALELRKKQMKAQVERHEKMAEQTVPEPEAEGKTEDTHERNDAPTVGESSTAVSTEVEPEKDVEDDAPSIHDAASSQELAHSGLGFSSSRTKSVDLNSTASISSPISTQTHGSSGAPSTRPSSLSEDDNPAPKEDDRSESEQDSQDSDFVDEEESVDSIPTVVPESRTPIPSFIHTTSAAEESHDDAQARRRSQRNTTFFVPSGDPSPLDDAKFKQRNRDSLIIPNSKRQSWYETKEKRRALLDPIQVSAENSDAEYLSDDSFMEELQSATVQQAKPMSVHKSPIAPWFPRKASPDKPAMPERSASQAYHKMSNSSSSELLSRKTSGPWPPQVSASNVGVAKKINVSSGISQRIRALAEKSNRETSPPLTPGQTPQTPNSSLAQRKSSFFATASTETSPNSSRSITRLGAPSFLTSSASSSPDRKRSKTPQPIKATLYNVQKATQPESVQVTARIVRDERTKMPTLAMPTESTPLDLHQSPLIIDHQKATRRQKSPVRGRSATTSPIPPSTSHSSREQSLPPSRASTESGWRTFSRRMSETRSIHSVDTETDQRSIKTAKKESRTSKMFKRMSSSMSTMPWKSPSHINTLVHPERTTSLASLREPPPPVHIGDLNIQFPDTLLWRRRWVEIDSMGNLVLSPSKSNEKGVVKRFHLSELRTPYPPDQDRQEMPNSVVLDFIDGRTLQCACETYTAQAQVLQSKSMHVLSLRNNYADKLTVLREAHDAWLAYNQAV